MNDEWFDIGTPVFWDNGWQRPRHWFYDGNQMIELVCEPGLGLAGVTTCGKQHVSEPFLCVLPPGHECKHLPVGLRWLEKEPFHVTRISTARST